jgi:alpha-N-arabinofuranosidase
MRGNYAGEVNFHFQSITSGAVLGSTSAAMSQTTSSGWVQTFSPTFQPSTSASNANNTFYFTFNGTELAGQTVYFNLFSVFKQTFKNRNNGLREDLAESLVSLNQAYLRLPGGNNMEGNSPPYEWKWNLTIGDLKNRPGRPGTWGDVNTDGLGLLEMMQWCTDMGLTVVLGVWAGLYLDGTIIAQANLQPYVNSVLNELEFLLVGDAIS